MSREEKLSILAYEAGTSAVKGWLKRGEGEEFLIQICGWTQEEVDQALEGYEE